MSEPLTDLSNELGAPRPSFDLETGLGIERVRITFGHPGETIFTGSSAAVMGPLEVARTATGEMRPYVGANIEAEWHWLRLQRLGDPAYEPARTPLGAKLRRWRARYIESGGRLLTWEEIEREVAERRGGVETGA